MHTLKKILYLLSNQERKHAYLLMAMILVMALLDMLGVASILPFISVLSNPELIDTNEILKSAYQASSLFGVENKEQFLFISGIFVFFFLIISLTFKALTNYTKAKFTSMREYSIGRRLIEGYLNQPYSWFLNRHSADLGKTILSEVNSVVGKGLGSMMTLFMQITVTIALLSLLIIVDPKLTLIIGLTLGSVYFIIYKFTQIYIAKIGKDRFMANQLRFTSVSEAFGAAKEIKVGGLEKIYIKRFSDPAKILAKSNASMAIFSLIPRFALEAIIFGGMLIVTLYLMKSSGNFTKALPVIALYAFAGYRLMPALQQIYSSITALIYISPSLNSMYNDIKKLHSLKNEQNQESLLLKNNLTLKNIYYNYPNASRTTLKDLNLVIPANSTVGLVGTTGSGKTTTVDIILGLLEAQRGTIEVDGKVIDKFNRRAWQNSIGYVPQHIFLADDTISANIAFGIEQENVNQEALLKAAKIANLHEFVINELHLGYQTTIGERGIRLSGGQRQRIGIARALYRKPQVLILDEATSALDNLTEQAVMEAVHNIGKNITIILIAHRLTTVRECDIIFQLENGILKEQGSFEKLVETNKNFRTSAAKI